MNAAKTVIIYPRGYMGYDIGLPVRQTGSDMAQVISSMRYNKATMQKARTVVSNEQLDQAYLQMIRGDRSVRKMGFREHVIKLALGAFGTDSFYDWCVLQQESPYFTDNHRRFLNDTFKFIECGERSMSIRTWSQLLGIRSIRDEDQKTVYRYKEFFKQDQPSHDFRRPIYLEDVIVAWTSQPGGLEDMLHTLRILFGDITHI